MLPVAAALFTTRVGRTAGSTAAPPIGDLAVGAASVGAGAAGARCVIVTAVPAIVTVAIRSAPVFAATVNWTVPLPLPVAPWEIVMKLRVGKLSADLAGITDAVQRGGFTLLDIAIPHLRALAGLPMHHRDPFDHLLIAQAVTEDALLVTEDRHAALYPVRTVPCADANHPTG